MDLGDDPAHDLLDQDMGSVTLCSSSRTPVCSLALYKRLPNFGDSEIGMSQSLLSILGDNMDIDKSEASRIDSPLPPAPVPAPSSQQDATLPSELPSTSASVPDSDPVELQRVAEEEQSILLGETSAGGDEDD